ncbi:MAG TPA: S53 family peptidase [Bryobacteraceae bacterium]|nr:S53 family peptidase [Bryobacteraceae bacterium]
MFPRIAAVCLSVGVALCGTGHPRVVTQPVDESRLLTLHGNVRPEANPLNDRGRLQDSSPLSHLLLQLKRSPEAEAEAEEFLASQQDPQSANYHHWISPAEFGERFGAAQADIDAVTEWLRSKGFAVNQVHPNRLLIDFSGSAGQVRGAFHAEIHHLEVEGRPHIGNMTDPEIPEALAPVIEGVVSLNDFMPHALKTARADYTFTSGGSTYQAVVPGDLATIYNFTPAFAAGYTGLGQTIVVVEDTNVYSAADFTKFRSAFGLSSAYPHGSLVQVHPAGSGGACTNPGVNGDDGEAEIDVEWATAAAPDATIELASCANTRTNFGGFIALQNLLSQANPPAVVSISYGEAETLNGASGNAYINSLYQTAAAAGVSVFVSSGDEGAASADAGATSATHGVTVSAFATTPYNVAVGGTDFADSYLGSNASYWNSANNGDYSSALSYVPEIPWNDSCASVLLANVLGYTTTYGKTGFCASSTAKSDGLLEVVGGSGGPSNCATGKPAKSGVAGGTCKGYAKPSWQAVYGNPADGVRDIPDVSLFAANGLWGHYYVVCYSDTRRGGASCSGAPSTWAGFGGTSVSSPIMAGVQALINQKNSSRAGNPNPRLYALAKAEYGASGNSGCDSSAGAGVCAFHDVTLGDMDVNCTAGSPNCYAPGLTKGNGGVLSTSTSAYQPAYGTARGWDFSTGIGSVNVWVLLQNW